MRHSTRPLPSRHRPTPAWSPLLLLSGSVAAAVLVIGTTLSVAGDGAETLGEERQTAARPGAEALRTAEPVVEPLRVAAAVPLR